MVHDFYDGVRRDEVLAPVFDQALPHGWDAHLPRMVDFCPPPARRRKLLGDAATAPLLDAWAEAYGELADALIATERALYAQAGVEAGELRAMRVTEVLHQSEDVRSFTLEAIDGRALPAFKPGQYVSVEVKLADGRRQLRQYSLSDSPVAQHLRISVKRETAGAGIPAGQVSNWLHENVKAGDTLHVSHPFGDFTPDVESNDPVVLLSAGIGITPMVAALNHIARVNPSRHVFFAHAARDAAHHAHQGDVAAAKAVMPNLRVFTFHEAPADDAREIFAGRMDVNRLPSWPRTETNVYLCGPLAFMREQWQALVAAGVPAVRLHREVFGPELLDHLG